MKFLFRFSGIIIIIILFLSCKKQNKVILSPSVVTSPVTEILYSFATSGGIVTNDGGDPSVRSGVCWGTSSGPTIENDKTVDGSGEGNFVSSVNGLNFGTSYFLRSYAINSSGTAYGNELEFKTKTPAIEFNTNLTYGTVTDIDGKNYKTIPIGIQVWMAENLRTTKFNDGSAIPPVTDDTEWSNLITPAYGWCDNNDTLYANIYGAYYNWFAVSTGNLCPSGWHVPSDTEWQQLADYLGGSNMAGSKLKETGTNNWVLPNTDATNETGFTALPAGQRGSLDGTFSGQGIYGGWWSATELDSSPLGAAWCRLISGDTTVVTRNEFFKQAGFNVRCVKD